MGKKKSLFLFSITELAVLEISYISIAHDQWSQYGGLYFIVGKLVSSFFEVIFCCFLLLLFWKKS